MELLNKNSIPFLQDQGVFLIKLPRQVMGDLTVMMKEDERLSYKGYCLQMGEMVIDSLSSKAHLELTTGCSDESQVHHIDIISTNCLTQESFPSTFSKALLVEDPLTVISDISV